MNLHWRENKIWMNITVIVEHGHYGVSLKKSPCLNCLDLGVWPHVSDWCHYCQWHMYEFHWYTKGWQMNRQWNHCCSRLWGDPKFYSYYHICVYLRYFSIKWSNYCNYCGKLWQSCDNNGLHIKEYSSWKDQGGGST